MLTQNKKIILLLLLISLVSVELLRTAWISDDAAITLRVIENFIHGYGPNFNVGERVQAYTHPLWFLFLSFVALFINNIFIVTLIVSILMSLFTLIFLIIKIARNFWLGFLSILLLSLSKAYVDFSTSGLENVLSHFIILVGIFWGNRVLKDTNYKHLLYFFLSCSLLYLNRPDLILIFFPLFCHVLFSNSKVFPIVFKALLLAALPVIIWTLFAIYYYGFPFPNTAYAKLATGIGLSERISQGVNYFIDSYERDPITLSLIVIGSILGLWQSRLTRYLTVGVLFYLCYIISVGGDFMSGRFFTSPLLVAVAIIALSDVYKIIYYVILSYGLLIGIARVDYTLLSSSDYNVTFLNEYGIADERGFYFQQTGLLNSNQGLLSLNIPPWKFSEEDKDISIKCGRLGFSGLLIGPNRFFIDNCALVDPLLARLPAKYNKHWRIGHFYRQLPNGYLETIMTQSNSITDPDVKKFYDAIASITKGELNTFSRIKNIIRVNSGAIYIKDKDKYRYTSITYSPLIIDYELLNHSAIDSGEWDKKGSTIFLQALLIKLPKNTEIISMDLSLANSDYRIDYISKERVIFTAKIAAKMNSYGLIRYHLIAKTSIKNVDSIRITAVNLGDFEYYSLGHIIINE